jgi:ribosomal protein S27AE
MQTTTHNLAQRIQELRGKGYPFEKDLEPRAAAFETQWSKLAPGVSAQINTQSALLTSSFRSLEVKMTQLVGMRSNPAAGKGLADTVEAEIDMVKDRVSAAGRAIDGMYDALRREVTELGAHLTRLDWSFTQLAEAGFKLLSTEGLIMAVKAVWCPNGKEDKDDPEGVLYLTDQRLLFEQKEEVAAKKVLFITTEKKKVQELKWETPVALVQKIQTSKQGMMKNEDHLDLQMASGAPFPTLRLHIWQPCEEWLQLINRVQSRDFDQNRAVAIDQTEVEKVKAAPSQCPACGGGINQVVLRGQDRLKCEYCGFVIRL